LISYGLLSLGCSTGLSDNGGICFGVYDFGCSGLYGLLSLGCSTGLSDNGGICFGVYDFGCSGLFAVFGFDV
jgi:hypothetical protein